MLVQPMKIAIYCRVSTPRQGGIDRYSLPEQHKDGQEFAKKNGFEFREYEDIQSGKSVTRSGYLSLLEAIEARKFDGLWIAREDRFARNAIAGLQLLEVLEEHKVRFFVGDKEYDPSSEDSKFIVRYGQ